MNPSLPIHRALLVHGGALGDFILSLTIVNVLREAGAQHVAVLGRAHARVAVPYGGVDQALDLDTGGFTSLFSNDLAIPLRLRKQLAEVDLAINMLPMNGIVAKRLCEAGVTRVIDIDPNPQSGSYVHITEQWLCELKRYGLQSTPSPPRIQIPYGVSIPPRNEIIVHPGSGSPQKCWPTDRFLTLIKRLQNRGYKVRIMFGPVEMESWSQSQRAEFESAVPMTACEFLGEAIAILHMAALFIGNDSGISHLSAALGVPSLTIFGPTDPRIWRPLGQRVGVVARKMNEWPTVEECEQAAVGLLAESESLKT